MEDRKRRLGGGAAAPLVIFVVLILLRPLLTQASGYGYDAAAAVGREEYGDGDGSGRGGGREKSYFSKMSGIIIPGFASTQLRAWSVLDCPYSPLDFNPLDSVWLDTTRDSGR